MQKNTILNRVIYYFQLKIGSESNGVLEFII